MTDPATLRALAEAATPGPWQDANGYVIADGRVLTLTPNNRAYIAAVDPQTVLALLDRADALEKALETAARTAHLWDPSDLHTRTGLNDGFPRCPHPSCRGWRDALAAATAPAEVGEGIDPDPDTIRRIADATDPDRGMPR